MCRACDCLVMWYLQYIEQHDSLAEALCLQHDTRYGDHLIRVAQSPTGSNDVVYLLLKLWRQYKFCITKETIVRYKYYPVKIQIVPKSPHTWNWQRALNVMCGQRSPLTISACLCVKGESEGVAITHV